jgi:hypothetical protein
LNQLDTLMFEGVMWNDLLQPIAYTKLMCGLAFRLVSRSICQVENDLRFRHLMMPTRMMVLVHNPELLDSILDIPRCLWDDWALKLEAECAEFGGLGGERAHQRRLLYSRMAKTDTGAIESLHAALRRRLKMLGVQTHGVLFDEASAGFVVERAGARHHRWDHLLPPQQSSSIFDSHNDRVDGVEDIPHADTHDDGRVGGPWHSFIRDRTLGVGKADFKALALEYRALPGAEHRRHVEIGAAASAAQSVATTSSSFGPTGWEIKRESQKRARDAHLDSIVSQRRGDEEHLALSGSTSHVCVASVANRAIATAPHGSTFSDTLLRARREVKYEKHLCQL